MTTRFLRYELRTTHVDAARAFYAAVLGDGAVEVVALPEAAAARGAPAHWLGHLGVADVEGAAAAFVERGATRLGPTRPTPNGGAVAIVRDPGGAVVALATSPVAPPRGPDVAWCVLNAADLARAVASYRELFGWEPTGRLDLGALGVFQQFAWGPGGESVGSMADVRGRPGVHPHWLFHFRVDAMDRALAAVRAGGGAVALATALPGGDRVAVCDDPQGAAFALLERAAG